MFAEDMPGFERLSDFEIDAPLGHAAIAGEAEFEVRGEPVVLQRIAMVLEVADDVAKIFLHEMRKHEAVVQFDAPADEFLLVGSFPETGDQGAEQELLREAHAGMRRHFERTQFEKAETAGGALGRE